MNGIRVISAQIRASSIENVCKELGNQVSGLPRGKVVLAFVEWIDNYYGMAYCVRPSSSVYTAGILYFESSTIIYKFRYTIASQAVVVQQT